MGRIVTRREVLALLDLDDELLVALEREAIVVAEPSGRYQEHTIERIRRAQTLHDDLGVNLAGVEVILNLLDIIDRERRYFAEELGRVRGRRRQR